MILADGGNIALTAQSDRFTTAKWEGLLGPLDLRTIQPSDFELVNAGPRLTWTGDCVRAP
jgi:serine/threonine-protein kinase